MTLARNLADLGNQVDSSGTLGVGGGGTSATTANAGFNALAPNQTSNTNKYLTTNGTNTSWADIVSGMTITSITYSGDDQAVDPTNPLPVTINGSNFVANSLVYIDTISSANSGTSINVTSSSTIVFTPPTGKSAASYNIWVVSPTGQMAILANGLLYSGAPSWAGQSTSLSAGADVSIQLTATGDTPLVYSLVSGTLPTGTTLSSSGLISGTASTAGTFPNIVVKATDPESQDASITIEITITLGDDYFEYVTMLLHGDGANGVQNNTFVDSSTNNFTITRNGNTTQGSFSPYGSLWSNYLTGGATLEAATGSAVAFGSGDYTVEMWIYPTAAWDTGGQNMVFFNGSTNGFMFANRPSGFGVRAVNNTDVLLIATRPTINTWTHIAACRSGGTLRIFYNGVLQGSTTDNISWASGNVIFGSESGSNIYNGYISNCRVVKGTALYTSNFTPSTTPLTAVTNTSFLGFQSNRFIDNSSNAISISITAGTPSVQRFSPFNPTASYSTATIGGSGYFPNNTGNNRLSIPYNSALDFGTGAFTVEFWSYPTEQNFYGQVYAASANGAIQIAQYGTRIIIGRDSIQEDTLTPTGTLITKQWNHVVITRNGSSNLAIFINGIRQAYATNSNSYTLQGNELRIGHGRDYSPYAYGVIGYISNLRVANATALYDPTQTTITVPTSPVTAISGVSLLCNMTNAGIPDSAMMNDLETVGNAQVSTSVKKFGTGSLAFDGNGDYLVPNTATPDLYAFGSGDFTIECWLYTTNVSQQVSIFYDGRPSGTNTAQPTLYLNYSNIYYFTQGTDRITGQSLSTNTWYHIAVCRSGTSTKLFVNGTQTGSTYTDTNTYTNTANRPVLGTNGSSVGNNYFYGYIDDLRITKGYARYTANFTPPTESFPNY